MLNMTTAGPYNPQQFAKAYDPRMAGGQPSVQQPYQQTPPNLSGGGQWWQRGQLPNMPQNYGYTPGPIPYKDWVAMAQKRQQMQAAQAMGNNFMGGTGNTGGGLTNPFSEMLRQQGQMQQQQQQFSQRPQSPQQNPYLPLPKPFMQMGLD